MEQESLEADEPLAFQSPISDFKLGDITNVEVPTSLSTGTAASIPMVKRGRGRPRGSAKYDTASLSTASVEYLSTIEIASSAESTVKRKPGRPRGSVKNGRVLIRATKPPKKPKTSCAAALFNKQRNCGDSASRKRKGEPEILPNEPEPKHIIQNVNDTDNETDLLNSTPDKVDLLKNITNLVDTTSPKSGRQRFWFNGYKFRRCEVTADITVWRCINIYCAARFKIASSGEIVYANNKLHLHDPPPKDDQPPKEKMDTSQSTNQQSLNSSEVASADTEEDDPDEDVRPLSSIRRKILSQSLSSNSDKSAYLEENFSDDGRPLASVRRKILSQSSTSNSDKSESNAAEARVSSRAAHAKAWFDGFRFSVISQSKIDGISTWRCTACKCSASIRTDKSETVFYIGSKPHLHAPPNPEQFKDTYIVLQRNLETSTIPKIESPLFLRAAQKHSKAWFDGFRFSLVGHNTADGLTAWRCSAQCSARIKTDKSGAVVYIGPQPHTHPAPDPKQFKENALVLQRGSDFTTFEREASKKAWFEGCRFSRCGVSRWRCTSHMCSASIKTDDSKTTVVYIGPHPHVHAPPNPEQYKDSATAIVLQRGSDIVFAPKSNDAENRNGQMIKGTSSTAVVIKSCKIEPFEEPEPESDSQNSPSENSAAQRALRTKAWFDDFRYTLHSEPKFDGLTVWRCSGYMCSAFIKTDKSEVVVHIGAQPHSHRPPDPERFKQTVIVLQRGPGIPAPKSNTAQNRNHNDNGGMNDVSSAVAETNCKMDPLTKPDTDTYQQLHSMTVSFKRQKLSHSALTRALTKRLNQCATLNHNKDKAGLSHDGKRSAMKQAPRISTAAIRKALKSSNHRNGGEQLSAVGDLRTPSAVASNSPPRRRRYFRSRTTIPFDVADDTSTDSDNDNSERRWMLEDARRMLAEFVDVNPGERRLMTLWNEFMFERVRHRADRGMALLCCEFVAVFGKKIVEENLTRNFFCHLAGLNSHRILTAQQVRDIYEKIQELSVHDIVR